MNSKKKIALVVSHPIQHFCPQYASFAKHTGIDFKVFFASSMGLEKYVDPNFKREISWGNLNLDAFEHEFLNNRALITSDEKLDAPDLEVALEKFNPDVVIIYGYFQKLSRRAHRWASSNGVKLAYISDSELRHKRNWFKSTLKRIWLYRYFSAIDFFLSVGDANEEFYRRHGVPSSRFVRMHFSIDKNYYDACFPNRDELKNKIRQQYGIAKDRCVTSVVGKLVPWKNQDHLIDALQLLEKQGKQVDALLVGSGEMEAAWTKKAEVQSCLHDWFYRHRNSTELLCSFRILHASGIQRATFNRDQRSNSNGDSNHL
jgi:glycosyltransferase involved in cell wall biosynthesis